MTQLQILSEDTEKVEYEHLAIEDLEHFDSLLEECKSLKNSIEDEAHKIGFKLAIGEYNDQNSDNLIFNSHGLDELDEEVTLNQTDIDDHESFILKVEIYKEKNRKVIYSLDKFIKGLYTSNSYYNLFMNLQNLKEKNLTTFKVKGIESSYLKTDLFCFYSEDRYEEDEEINYDTEFEDIVKFKDNHCHYLGEDPINMIPEFIYSECCGEAFTQLNDLFEKLKGVSSILYLANVSKWTRDDKLNIQLNGS